MQVFIAANKVNQIAAVHDVLRRTGGSRRFLNTKTIRVICKGDLFAALLHSPDLPPLCPFVLPSAIRQRIANLIISNVYAIERRQLILPVRIRIGERVALDSRTDAAGRVRIRRFLLNIAAMVIGSVLAGAIWAFVPAWFKSRWNTNETLFTLMMNYVATSIVACMTNIMRGQASSLGTLNKATKAGWLPVINGQRYTINIIVVLVLTFAMYAYLKYSKQGYEISVVGESENTARYAGINVSRVMIRTMLLSGAICGLCGFLVVAGKDQTISTTSAGGNGFTAIIVAWLAKFNTFYMMLISFLLIFLDRGASEIASAYSLNEYAADIITGIILFFILGSEFFINYRLVWRGHHDGKEGK